MIGPSGKHNLVIAFQINLEPIRMHDVQIVERIRETIIVSQYRVWEPTRMLPAPT